ncbi:CheR family methyltransferase [Methylomonas albis]|uniref:CheR family methyltransferase n=1 Tax=Methylomonas albis TaxID=1854563 RepID=UPI0022770B64|nr:protein-glutamate O-methyltransferase CheR [Methylomonas albis]
MTPEEFERFRILIYNHAGIALTPEKKVMVASRLAKRLDYYQVHNYGEYYQLATSPDYPHEFQTLVNILTTNETYFFREPKHFDFFQQHILKPWRGEQFRVWSAASSTGEEAYTLAMVLAENLGMRNWEIFGSDLSTRVLEIARQGVYPLDRLEQMDKHLLEKYCLKGVRSQEGFFRVDSQLRTRVKFDQINLMSILPPSLGKFEVIFLRNVLIYFDQDTKKQVVERLITALKPGGHFIISHSESLHRVTEQLQMIKPSIYRKP